MAKVQFNWEGILLTANSAALNLAALFIFCPCRHSSFRLPPSSCRHFPFQQYLRQSSPLLRLSWLHWQRLLQ